MVRKCDNHGTFGKELSEPGECEQCGAKVLRLYDDGICLMCKANRAHHSSFGKISIVKRLSKTGK